MNHERNLGVSEARAGLTLVICLLVVLGYMLLYYLGGTRQAPDVEVRPGVTTEPALAPSVVKPAGDELPQVLTIERSEPPEHARRAATDSELR